MNCPTHGTPMQEVCDDFVCGSCSAQSFLSTPVSGFARVKSQAELDAEQDARDARALAVHHDPLPVNGVKVDKSVAGWNEAALPPDWRSRGILYRTEPNGPVGVFVVPEPKHLNPTK